MASTTLRPSRATSLGWAAGIGRAGAILGAIISGLLVGPGLVVPWSFYTFVLLAGVITAVIIFLLPKSPVHANVEKAEWM